MRAVASESARLPKPYYDADGITIYHGDCAAIVPLLAYENVCTDPPYGIGFAAAPTKWQRRAGRQPVAWDDATVPDVVEALAADARPTIIWGGNYYALPPVRGWLAWLKPDAPPSMGSMELAWTNLDRTTRTLSCSISDTNRERVGHPTQKPLKLISWCFSFLVGGGRHARPVHGFGYDAPSREGSRPSRDRHRTRRALLRDRGAAASSTDAVRGYAMTAIASARARARQIDPSAPLSDRRLVPASSPSSPSLVITAPLAGQARGTSGGRFFREVLAPREAPCPPSTTFADALPFIGLGMFLVLEMLRLA